MCGGKVLSKPYPTPRLGISAPQAVSKISGSGGGAPYPIGGADRSGTRAPARARVYVKIFSEGMMHVFRVLEQFGGMQNETFPKV